MKNIRVKIFAVFSICFLTLTCTNNKTTTQPPPPAGADTTSHNFTWTIDTIGTLNSVLFDVTMINENDIWAVGEIHTDDTDRQDSLGNWVQPFNAAHWNGSEWELQRFVQANGNTILSIRGLWYFSENNIWLAAGSVYHWNGINTNLSYLRNINTTETVERLWASSPSNIYGVGNAGLIVHYDGSSWQKLESNTTTRLLGIWGNANGSAVWACGHASNNSESILLRYDGSQWQTVWRWQFQQGASDSAYVGLLSSLWAFDPDSLIVVGGDGVFRQDISNSVSPRKENLFLDAFPLRVRGSAPNNIFICGDNGRIWHYNGATWQTYPELHNSNWVWRSIAVLENKVVAVGEDFSQVIQRDIIVTGLRP